MELQSMLERLTDLWFDFEQVTDSGDSIEEWNKTFHSLAQQVQDHPDYPRGDGLVYDAAQGSYVIP